MKKSLLSLLSLLMTFPIWAHYFDYTYEGQTLHYTVLSETDKTVEIIPDNDFSGSLVIPTTVSDGIIEYTVTSIGKSAFSGSMITSVIIPNSVTSIREYAFYLCDHLTNVTIPNSVTTIGQYAFSLCDGLTSMTIPNSVTSIGEYAFYFCDRLTNVTISNSVTYIGQYAFGMCEKLTAIDVDTDNPNYASIEGIVYNKDLTRIIIYPSGRIGNYAIPNHVTTIGEDAFALCDGLTSITIPNTVTSIGNCAFEGCENLTSIAIPNSVISIGNEAFFSCLSLSSLTISNSVKYIGESAFGACMELNEVNYLTDDPIVANIGIFNHETYSSAVLTMAKGGLARAQSTEPWRLFTNIVEEPEDGIEELLTISKKPSIVFDLQGRRISIPAHGGVYILDGKKVIL